MKSYLYHVFFKFAMIELCSFLRSLLCSFFCPKNPTVYWWDCCIINHVSINFYFIFLSLLQNINNRKLFQIILFSENIHIMILKKRCKRKIMSKLLKQTSEWILYLIISFHCGTSSENLKLHYPSNKVIIT